MDVTYYLLLFLLLLFFKYKDLKCKQVKFWVSDAKLL